MHRLLEAPGVRRGEPIDGGRGVNANAWRNGAALLLLGLGLAQMASDLLGSRVGKGVAAITVASPCPKVFCDVDGLEPFASRFELQAEVNGELRTWQPTPELYAGIRGPYNRRNAYGAALVYAPRLPEPLRAAVYQYAFAGEGRLRRELGLPPEAQRITVIIRSQTRGRHEVWSYTE